MLNNMFIKMYNQSEGSLLNLFSPTIQQYFEYTKHHAEIKNVDDLYSGYYKFLTDTLGMKNRDADEEVAYVMNKVCDFMD